MNTIVTSPAVLGWFGYDFLFRKCMLNPLNAVFIFCVPCSMDVIQDGLRGVKPERQEESLGRPSEFCMGTNELHVLHTVYHGPWSGERRRRRGRGAL